MTATRRRTSTWSVAILPLVLGLAFSARTQAQPAGSLDRHQAPVLATDGFGLNTAETSGRTTFGANLQLDYANDPAVLEVSATGQSLRVVHNQLRAHLSLSLTLADRAVIYLGVPADLVLSGLGTSVDPNIPTATGANLGDPYVGARVRLLGTTEDKFMLAVQGQLAFPVAQMIERPTYSGDRSLGGRVYVLPQFNLGMLRLVLSAGANFHRRQNYPDTGLDNELLYGVGATISPFESVPLSFLAEYRGTTSLGRFGDREQTNMELLGGVRYTHENTGLTFGAAGAAGLSNGVGTPDFRVLGSIGWQQRANGDRDDDGIANDADQCPDVAEDRDGYQDEDGCPDEDNDQDGIPDAADQCPADAEDIDQFQDEDGCPDTDNDGDGVLDANDAAPNEPEDVDGFQDADGAPDLDNDGDQVPDSADGAPMDPEDRDGFEDENGIPDPDNDGDQVGDAIDRCPNEAGVVENRGCPDRDRDGDTVVDRLDNCPDEAGTVQNQGCRARQLVTIERDRIVILTRVFFQTGRATIQSRSFGLLNNVAAVLNAHPEIQSIRVEGHTDARGNADDNMILSQDRAQAVVDYLVQQGVAASRLNARGFGSTQPRVENPRNNRELEQNRRVEFVVEDR